MTKTLIREGSQDRRQPDSSTKNTTRMHKQPKTTSAGANTLVAAAASAAAATAAAAAATAAAAAAATAVPHAATAGDEAINHILSHAQPGHTAKVRTHRYNPIALYMYVQHVLLSCIFNIWFGSPCTCQSTNAQANYDCCQARACK